MRSLLNLTLLEVQMYEHYKACWLVDRLVGLGGTVGCCWDYNRAEDGATVASLVLIVIWRMIDCNGGERMDV